MESPCLDVANLPGINGYRMKEGGGTSAHFPSHFFSSWFLLFFVSFVPSW
jgi:hypothetical protein